MNTRLDGNEPTSPFEALPAEIIHSVLTFLSPWCLSSVAQTSQTLRVHAHNDLLWARLVKESVPKCRSERLPAPYQTWKELYVSHHPYWFIPRGKIWFSDRSHVGNALMGSMIVARYDPRRACIEAYQLVAERSARYFTSWEWKPDVIIHHYYPKVQLWLDNPIFMLRGRPEGYGGPLQETLSESYAIGGIPTTIFLCRPIPPQLQDPSMALWPPATLPATQRVRSDSQSLFEGLGHKPRTLGEASDCTFRIRTWLELHGIGRLPRARQGENVMTFSTLPEEAYTPTKEKPWQGIWVGDYSGHGCEFLVVLQTSASRPSHADSRSHDARPIPTGPNEDSPAPGPVEAWPSTVERNLELDRAGYTEELEDGSCRGKLEAIKLTGDPNVPRGEYSWIADDIGPQGLIRIADEEPFRGARIVRSKCHVAEHEFQNGGAVSLPGKSMGWNTWLTRTQIGIFRRSS